MASCGLVTIRATTPRWAAASWGRPRSASARPPTGGTTGWATACRARRGSRAACWRPHGVPEDGVRSRQRGARPRPQPTRILWWGTSHRMLSRFRPASRPAPRSSSRGGSCTASPVIPIGFPPLVVRSVQHTVGRSARQTVITARPASAGAGHRTAEYRRNNKLVLRRYSAVATSTGPPQDTNPTPLGPPFTHWRPGRSSGQRSAGLWPSLSRAHDGEGGPRTPFDQADPARSTVLVRTPSGAGRNQAIYPEHVRVSSPVSPDGLPARAYAVVRRTRRRGGAVRGAAVRAGWGRPPRGVACACCARYATSWSPASSSSCSLMML